MYQPFALVLALTAFGAPVLAADQTWHCMAPANLSKHEVSDENLVLGGIQISEEEGELAHLPVIRGAFTARNKSTKDFHVALEILGSDDKGPVFAMSVAPSCTLFVRITCSGRFAFLFELVELAVFSRLVGASTPLRPREGLFRGATRPFAIMIP